MKAVICGAGIAGLALAWWLDRDGWQVLLIEQAPGPRAAGYMIDFAGSGYDVVEMMGLLPRLREAQATNRVIRYVDPSGRGLGHLTYDLFAEPLGGRVLTFMRGDLERTLRDALGDRVPIRYGTTIDHVRAVPTGAEVTFSDGHTESAALLVGADGIHSQVRALAFGPEALFLRYLGFHTASYVFDDDWLRSRVNDGFLLVAAAGRQVGLYPTNDGRLAAWLVHRARDPGLPSNPRATLRDVHGDMGDLAARVLAHCPPGRDLYYDHVAQIEMDRWTCGAVTLVGDACQAPSLMAGQGASLALGGAYVLAEELRRGGPAAAAASRYEQRMRPFGLDKQKLGRRTARWLVPSTRWGIAVRAAALMAARLPGVVGLLGPSVRSIGASIVRRPDTAKVRHR